MKKFTLIEADRYISVDGKGVWFDEKDWPFPDIEHLWAIQWTDNETLEGIGQIEYDSADRPNDPATRSNIQKYVDAWKIESNKKELERISEEEQEKKDAYSWSEAMKELEEQMEEMQIRHTNALTKSQEQDKDAYDKLQTQLRDQEDRHSSSLLEMMSDHDAQMDNIHEQVARQHEELFYNQDVIENQEPTLYSTNGLDNITLFDGNVDPSLFDDVIDDEHFKDEVISDKTIGDIDLTILDSEFNLELLFEDDSEEQVVAEIENLIAQDESGIVLDSLVQEVDDEVDDTKQ